MSSCPVAVCDAGHWGADCAQSCDCKNGDGSCDALTGQCNCEAGYTGKHCHQSKCLLFLIYAQHVTTQLQYMHTLSYLMVTADGTKVKIHLRLWWSTRGKNHGYKHKVEAMPVWAVSFIPQSVQLVCLVLDVAIGASVTTRHSATTWVEPVRVRQDGQALSVKNVSKAS